jgi:hypothetical protein
MIALAVLLMIQTADPVARPAESQTIDTIIIDNGNIFHGTADGAPRFVVKLANALHIPTRQWVIRRRLLVDRGDRLDQARLEETERALRGLGVFRFVRVDTLRLKRDGQRPLALAVVTADGWSTQPQASYTKSAGDEAWEVGFVERNFLGTATELSVNYARNPDRRRFDFGFASPQLFVRRGRLAVHYSNLSDGRAGGWQVGVPFYETGARHALETYGESANQRVLRYENGALLDSAQHRVFIVGVTGGFAPHATTRDYVRVWGGAEWRRESYDSLYTGSVPYSSFSTLRAGVDLGRMRFRVLEQFNSYSRREDVDLSPRVSLGLVLESELGYEVSAQTSAVWKRGFARLRADANGLDSTRARARFTVVTQNLRRNTFIAHVEAGTLHRPKRGAEFDLWAEQHGPRLFGVHDFTGTRMTWIVLEDRILVAEEFLGLMGLGVAPFVDYGGAWFGADPRLSGDVGLSLRFGPTRAVRGEAAEIAFGYRFGEAAGGKRWAVTLRKGVVF